MRGLVLVPVLLALAVPAWAAEAPPHELSGVLTKTVKHLSPYELKLDGMTGRFFLRGDVLKGVAPGTRVWVKGRIRTELFKPARVSPFPVQWHIFMDVAEVRKIDRPFDMAEGEKGGDGPLDGRR